MQVQAMPIFSTSIDSAFDADSIDTKINDFDENFSEIKIDGRPNFSTSKPQITPTNSTLFDNLYDSDFKRAPHAHFSNSHIISNSQRPRQLPVGPASDANSYCLNSNLHSSNTDHSDSISFNVTDSDCLPNCKPISLTTNVPNSFTPNATDSTVPKRNDYSVDHMFHPSTSFTAHLPPDSDSDDIEEPPDTDLSDSRPFGSEIIFRSDTHYDPLDPNGNPNPAWFICTADPQLTKHTPLRYTNENGEVEGVLVARGQLCFVDGQPSVNSLAPVLNTTADELESKMIDPTSMVDPSSVPSEPFLFQQSVDVENEFVQHVHDIFNNLLVQVSINVSNSFYFQNNEWSYITNNIFFSSPQCLQSNVEVNLESNKVKPIVTVVETPVNIVSNSLRVSESTTPTEAHVEHHLVNVLNDTINTEAFVQNHSISVTEESFNTNATVQNHTINVNECTVNTEVSVQNHSINVNESTVNTDVSVQNHSVNVNESSINTDVFVQNHSVNVNESTVNTDVTVQNHSVNVNDSTVNTDVSVQNHSVNVNESSIITDVFVQNHSVNVNENTINTNVSVQNHSININESNVNTDVSVQNHSVNVVESTINTEAHVQNHAINVMESTINTDARVQNHSIHLTEETINSNASVQHHKVEVNEDTTVTDAFIEHHKINALNNVICSDALVEQHTINVNEVTLHTDANVVSNDLSINHTTIPVNVNVQENTIDISHNEIHSLATLTSNFIDVQKNDIVSNAHVQNHLVNVSEKTIESNVVLPHFVFNFVEEEVPINIPFSKVVNSITQSSSTSDGLSSTSFSSHPSSSDNSESAPNSSYSNGSSSMNADDGHNERGNSSSSTVDDSEGLYWIIERLKQINNKAQLEELIHDIQLADINMSPWLNDSIIKTPIILMMYKLHSWIGVGTFYCPHCEDVFQSPAALHAHWKTQHGKRLLPNEQAAIEHIYKLKLRWKIIDDDLPEDIIRYRNIWSCPCHKCDYIVNNPNALACHIKTRHPGLESLRLEVGLFWAALILFTKEEDKLMSARDLFDSREGALCLRCKRFIGQDLNKIQQHTKSSHPAANIEGSRKLSRSITLKACWLNEGINDDEIAAADKDLEKEITLKDEQLQINEQARNAPAQIEETNTDHERAANDRRNYEKRLRNRREKGFLITGDDSPENRLHELSTDDDDDVSNSNDIDSPCTDVNNSNLSKDDLLKFFQKSRGWIDRNNEDLEKVVPLPKIWGDRLKKFRKKFDSLFEDKINVLLDSFDAFAYNSHFNLSEDEKNILWEGVIAKIHLLIRKLIRECLHIAKFESKRSKNSNRVPKSLELPIQIKSATKFTACIELIYSLLHSDEVLEQPTLNLISDLKEKAVNFLMRAPENFVQFLGGDDLDRVNALLESHNFEERIQFLHGKLEELEANHCNNSSAAYKKFIQKAYFEDSKKTLDWFILSEDRPECTIPLESFVNDYGSAWKDVALPKRNDEFKLPHTINEDDLEYFTKLLFNDKAIQSAITSRSNLSAVGCDGICNGIWKINKVVTTRIIKSTIKLMLSSGKFPSNLKACKTVMLFKKGDPSLTRSWRPITITSTLYRILMCHISRSMQSLNNQKRFICNQQKGFMKIPSGAAEHLINADEMIHHAARHHRSIYIVTIDFKDAFGSVPHKLIKHNLLDIGFAKPFVKSIMSSYDHCCTKIVSNGGMSEAIPFGKGVKQGCPLSPTLFNICIEPLLRKLNDMAVVDGYHWFNKATSVQAYADDIILFSDTEDGMCNLIKKVEEFCQFAGDMVINPKKCSSLSYVISNGARSTISSNFCIGNSDDDSNLIENVNLQGFTPYLGLPLAAHVSRKKHHIFQKILNMKHDVYKISSSSLKTTQVIDAIKRFILPKLDYELLINAAPTTKLEELDAFIRSCISKKIGSHGLPTDWFYSSKKDGGLNLQSLIDRYNALKIRLYVGLRESQDGHIKRMIISSDNDEMTFRDADLDPDSPFLNVPINDSGCILGKKHCGTSNLLNRTVKALHDIHFGLTHKNSTFTLIPLDTSNHINEQHEHYTVNAKNIMKILMKVIQSRHLNSLLTHPLKGHSFFTLLNSPLSNFFVNPRSCTTDSIVNFAFKARLGSLFTGSLQHLSGQDESNRLCPRCNGIETQHHLLNGCQFRKHEFTRRHDQIAKLLLTYLNDKQKVITHANQVVRGRDSERLEGQYSSLKPDIWWWNNNKLSIVEITVPYGMKNDREGDFSTTLDLRRAQKINKYKPLVECCKSQFNCDVELFVIVVSSLGAMPKETINDLIKLTKSKQAWKKLAMNMIITSLRESMFIYKNWFPDKTTPQNRINEDSPVHDNDPDSSSRSMSEVDDSVWNDLINDEHVSSTPSTESQTLSSDTAQGSHSDHEVTVSGSASDTDVLENDGLSPYWRNKDNEIDDYENTDSQDSEIDRVQRSKPSLDGTSYE